MERRPMNTLPPTKNARNRRTKGVALVMVLGMLVLIAGIILAFMSSVTTDVSASRDYVSQANVRLLADSAANMVMAQTRQAPTAADKAWISQPGLIRTF